MREIYNIPEASLPLNINAKRKGIEKKSEQRLITVNQAALAGTKVRTVVAGLNRVARNYKRVNGS